jgi:hypothetical protein
MSIYDTHVPESGGGGLWLKIGDGETVTLRLASEPAIFQAIGKEGEDGHVDIRTRYGWTVWNQNTKTAQILQQSATFYKSIAALAQNKSWGDPATYDIAITRSGTGLETSYNVMPIPNKAPLPKDATDAVASIDLIEKLAASQFNQNVAWLSDYDKTPKAAADPRDNPAAVQDQQKEMGTFNQDDIDPDDIPF